MPQPSLFSSLTDLLNQKHPLYLLANKIDWHRFDEALYSSLQRKKRSSCQAHPLDVWPSDSQAPA